MSAAPDSPGSRVQSPKPASAHGRQSPTLDPGHRTQDYFSSSIPEPVRLLGLQLRPLSVGRYRLLKRFDIAFVAEGPAHAGVPDLLLGVLICSMRVDEFLEFAAAPNFTRDIRRWSKRLFPHVWICALPGFGKWWRRKRGFNVLEKLAAFEAYIAEAQRIPRYTMRDNNPQAHSSHWSHNLEICLRSELGWTLEEINESPLSKALADYFRHAENSGAIILLTDDHFAAAAHNDAAIAAALAAVQSPGSRVQSQDSHPDAAVSPTPDSGPRTQD
jgi:hypothetical protein